MDTAQRIPHTHTCPGGCGRELFDALCACAWCTPALPAALRHDIALTWLHQDWPAHSRALTDALHHLSAVREHRAWAQRHLPTVTSTAPQGTP